MITLFHSQGGFSFTAGDTWLRLQAAYDLAQARKKLPALDIKRYEPV